MSWNSKMMALFVWLKKAPAITLKGIFHAHKNGFGFVSLEGEEKTSLLAEMMSTRYRWWHREIVITKVADRNKGNGSRS